MTKSVLGTSKKIFGTGFKALTQAIGGRAEMGTPVKIKAREEMCIGAGECSLPRPMTEEEIKKYYTEEEIEEMKGIKISPPGKEKLADTLAEVQGKSNALRHVAKIYFVSVTTVGKWVTDYGIQFDELGYVIREPEEEIQPKEAPEILQLDEEMQRLSEVENPDSIMDDVEAIHITGDIDFKNSDIGVKAKCEVNPADTITITGQETTEIPIKIGYVEYNVGKSLIQVDYRAEIVAINEMEFPLVEADAIADLLINIL